MVSSKCDIEIRDTVDADLFLGMTNILDDVWKQNQFSSTYRETDQMEQILNKRLVATFGMT